MQAEQWKNCLEVFEAAIERTCGERAVLIERTCHGDEALRRKVELLLKYHEQAGDFIAKPAFQIAPELLIDDPAALIGRNLGCYRVEAVAGRGGMGVVYLARDERLGRKVALKLLSQGFVAHEAQLERLRDEARTASTLNHPNIVTIHEIGQVDSTLYIATEFIEGVTLRERMAGGAILPKVACEIARQVASALGCAHRAGIVHRDIKPENIMLRPDGFVKVLDFGIAKLMEQESGVVPAAMRTPIVTVQREIWGTTGYMSPEQTAGGKVDARSDLWSLGVVLYEMLAGKLPVANGTPTDVMRAHAPVVPAALRKVVDRCLRKDPATRYQTAEEMLGGLGENKKNSVHSRATSASKRHTAVIGLMALLLGAAVFCAVRYTPGGRAEAPAGLEPSIAVMPFENFSMDQADAFLADGIQEDVLISLGKIKRLRVIARTSVMDFRGAGAAAKAREMGKALGVSHVLVGSIRRAADRVVVNVALIDTRDERTIWSERYERTLVDTISLQGQLAVEIARALQKTLTPAEASRAVTRVTENPDAYLLYLRAREVEFRNDNREQLELAAPLYQGAIDLDPGFALARARLSLCASALVNWEAGTRWEEPSRAEAEEAIRLQPQLGEARLALSHYYLWVAGDYDRALAELSRAAELLPNSAEVPLTAAYIYKRQGKYDDRIAALRRAEVLDPRNRKVLGLLACTFRWIRHWPEAMQSGDRLAVVAADDRGCPARWTRAQDEFHFGGDVTALKRVIADEIKAPSPANGEWLDVARYETAMIERDYAEAARFLAVIPPEVFRAGPYGAPAHSKAFHAALLAVASGAAEATKERALRIARDELEPRVGSNGTDKPEADLAVAYALLGRKDDAIRMAQQAIEVSAGPVGSIEKNHVSSALAMVYALCGEPDKAIALIEQLLTVPVEMRHGAIYTLSLTALKWRWQWDSLRGHPRFQKLLAGPEPKTVY
jgi:TolB-like protein/Flp pilus assembly protein TadD